MKSSCLLRYCQNSQFCPELKQSVRRDKKWWHYEYFSANEDGALAYPELERIHEILEMIIREEELRYTAGGGDGEYLHLCRRGHENCLVLGKGTFLRFGNV